MALASRACYDRGWGGKTMTDPKEIRTLNLEIQIDEATAMGQYCNMVIGQHSSSEFTLDFLYLTPGQPKARVRSRIILAPEHAKKLLKMLADGVANYEQFFGEIKMPIPPLPAPQSMQ
jgi:hypothetical protein